MTFASRSFPIRANSAGSQAKLSQLRPNSAEINGILQTTKADFGRNRRNSAQSGKQRCSICAKARPRSPRFGRVRAGTKSRRTRSKSGSAYAEGWPRRRGAPRRGAGAASLWPPEASGFCACAQLRRGVSSALTRRTHSGTGLSPSCARARGSVCWARHGISRRRAKAWLEWARTLVPSGHLWVAARHSGSTAEHVDALPPTSEVARVGPRAAFGVNGLSSHVAFPLTHLSMFGSDCSGRNFLADACGDLPWGWIFARAPRERVDYEQPFGQHFRCGLPDQDWTGECWSSTWFRLSLLVLSMQLCWPVTSCTWYLTEGHLGGVELCSLRSPNRPLSHPLTPQHKHPSSADFGDARYSRRTFAQVWVDLAHIRAISGELSRSC